MLSRQIKYFLTKCRLTSLALLEEDYDYTGEIQREKLLWTTRAGSCIGLGVAELEGWNRICWSQLLQFILKRNIYQKRKAELNLVVLLYSLYSFTFPNFLSADACIVQEYIISKSLSGKSFAISSESQKKEANLKHWYATDEKKQQREKDWSKNYQPLCTIQYRCGSHKYSPPKEYLSTKLSRLSLHDSMEPKKLIRQNLLDEWCFHISVIFRYW